jgi:hypothetical protein
VSPEGRSSTTPSPTSRRLSSAECLAWLGKRSLGRLGHLTGRGPRSTVVGYTVTDSQVIFRLPEYNEICQYAPGRPITLRVDCAAAGTQSRTQVVVTGVGRTPDHEEDLVAVVDLLEEWPSSVATHLLCLDLAVVEGHTVFDDQSSAPVGTETPRGA